MRTVIAPACLVVHLEDGGLLDEVELVGRHLLQPQLRLAAHAPRVVARLLLLRPEGNRSGFMTCQDFSWLQYLVKC